MTGAHHGTVATNHHQHSSPAATRRRTPVAMMTPLAAAQPPQDHEAESEQDDVQHGDAYVGPVLKKIMPNPVTDTASPEMARNTTGKRVRATKAVKPQSKRKSSKQQEPQLASGPDPMAGAGGRGFNLSTLQQSATPILLTATRMAPVPGLGYLFQDEYGIQMLVPYSMLPTQPRQQILWPADYPATVSQPMASSGPGLHSYSVPGGIDTGNLQYLNSGLGQYPQFQPRPVLPSTRFQPQAQPVEQGSFDESFTTASFESQGALASPQDRN